MPNREGGAGRSSRDQLADRKLPWIPEGNKRRRFGEEGDNPGKTVWCRDIDSQRGYQFASRWTIQDYHHERWKRTY